MLLLGLGQRGPFQAPGPKLGAEPPFNPNPAPFSPPAHPRLTPTPALISRALSGRLGREQGRLGSKWRNQCGGPKSILAYIPQITYLQVASTTFYLLIVSAELFSSNR